MTRPIVIVHLDIPVHDVDSDRYVEAYTRSWRFSDMEYRASDGTSYDPRIIGQVNYRRAANCVLWSRRPPQSGLGEIELLNLDGALDELLLIPVRDGRVSVYWLEHAGEAPSATTQIAGGFIDRIESAGESTIKIITSDVLEKLTRPLTELFYSSGLPQITGRPKPVAFGRPLSVPVVLVDDVDYYYDAHDTAGELAVAMVRDSGYPLSHLSGWQIAPSPHVGIELLRQPVGTVVADLSVPASASTDWLIDATEGDFAGASWSGSPPAPPGWTSSISGGGLVSHITSPVAGGWLRIDGTSGGTDRARITSSEVMPAGQRYEVRVIVDAHAFVPPLRVIETGSPDRVMMTITSPGDHGISWVANGGSVRLEVLYEGGDKPSAVVTLVTAHRRIITASGPQRWDWALRALCARAGIAASDIDTAGLEAEGDSWPRTVSFWSAQSPPVRTIADQIADSVLALLHSDYRGRFAARLLVPPPDTATPEVVIDDIDVFGEIGLAHDRAGNVPKAVSAGRNWHVYRQDDIADGVPDEERAMLSEDFRYRARVGLVGPEIEPRWSVETRAQRELERQSDVGLPTLLDTKADAEALAERIKAIWPAGYVARWIECEIYAPREALQSLRPGSIVSVSSARWGLDEQRCIVVEVSGSAGENSAKLLLWFTKDVRSESVTWSRDDITWSRSDITWSTP